MLLVNTRSSTPWFLILIGRDPKKTIDWSEPVNSWFFLVSEFYFQWEVPWWCPLFPGSEKKRKCTILVQEGWGHLETGVAPRRRHELGFQAGGSWKNWLCPLSSRPYFLWPFFLWASFSSLADEEAIVPHSVILKIKQANIRMCLLQSPSSSSIWTYPFLSLPHCF